MKPDGGPAFPQPLTQHPQGHLTFPWGGWGVGGMSLRDWLAGMALQGLLANPNGAVESPWQENYAKDAYSLSDAMLKEREK